MHKGRLTRAGLGAVLAIACWLAACGGGGGGPLSLGPDQATPLTIYTSDGLIKALIPVGAVDSELTLNFTNPTQEDRAVPGPTGRTLAMAVELIGTLVPVEEAPADEAEEPAAVASVNRAVTQDATVPEVPTLASPLEITFTLPTALPLTAAIPIYRYSESSERYEETSLSGALNETGTELSFSLAEFGRYAFYSLLPEEYPPASPGAPRLLAASTQLRKLEWDAPPDATLAGLNLYRAAAGADSFTKLNTELLLATRYVDQLPAIGAFEYYLTAVNTAGLESAASPLLVSPAVDFDLLHTFGRTHLSAPTDLAVSAAAGMLLVCDPSQGDVVAFDLTGKYLARINSYGAWAAVEPRGVAINPAGTRIYIADTSLQAVFILDTDFDYIGHFGAVGTGPGEFTQPVGVEVIYDETVIGDIVLVSDYANSTIQTFTGLGVYLDTVGSFGSEEGQFDGPNNIYAGAGEAIFISDGRQSRVQVFDESLAFGRVIELPEEFDGPLAQPRAMVQDFRERLYLCDAGNSRVVVFDSSDAFMFHFGADGGLHVEFFNSIGPQGIDIDPTTGYLYISDPGNHRIVVFTS